MAKHRTDRREEVRQARSQRMSDYNAQNASYASARGVATRLAKVQAGTYKVRHNQATDAALARARERYSLVRKARKVEKDALLAETLRTNREDKLVYRSWVWNKPVTLDPKKTAHGGTSFRRYLQKKMSRRPDDAWKFATWALGRGDMPACKSKEGFLRWVRRVTASAEIKGWFHAAWAEYEAAIRVAFPEGKFVAYCPKTREYHYMGR